MKRFFVWVGTSASVLVVAGICLAANPKSPNNQQPASPPQSQSGGGLRYVSPPPNSGANNVVDTNRRAAEVRRAQAAAAAAAQAQARAQAAAAAAARNAAAASAAANVQPSASTQPSYPYGYSNNGYNSPYGYPPYGSPYSPYGYSPPGTTPYVLSYNPATGTASLYPYEGGYSPYSYSSQYGGFGGYGGYQQNPYYRNPYLGYGYPSAVFVNPSQLYGIGPIQQLMGVSGWFGQPQANPNLFAVGNANQFANLNGNGNANAGLANRNDPPAAAQAADPAGPKAPAAGGRAMEIAWKFITFGDAHFGNQKFSDALDRYRRAARECPTLGDAWFREGFALAALGRYDQAAKAMRRGLDEKPDWADGNFRLAELYGDDAADRKSRLDEMVKAAEAQPTNADLAFVVGVHLFCDGKSDQAAPFLRRAAQIRGSDAEVKTFLVKGQ